jgi:hypothetical protein
MVLLKIIEVRYFFGESDRSSYAFAHNKLTQYGVNLLWAVTSVICSICACASKIRSKGSRCNNGNVATR